MKNLFFFNQRSNAAAQATECAYTTGQKFGVNPTKTSTFGRFATYVTVPSETVATEVLLLSHVTPLFVASDG